MHEPVSIPFKFRAKVGQSRSALVAPPASNAGPFAAPTNLSYVDGPDWQAAFSTV
jgi:hypothetical protein